MAFLEGLLGGLEGAAEAGGTALTKKAERDEKSAQEARQFQNEIVKALAQAQMMGKGDFDWGSFENTFGTGLLPPEFIESLKKGFKKQSQPKASPSPLSPLTPTSPSQGLSPQEQAELDALTKQGF